MRKSSRVLVVAGFIGLFLLVFGHSSWHRNHTIPRGGEQRSFVEAGPHYPEDQINVKDNEATDSTSFFIGYSKNVPWMPDYTKTTHGRIPHSPDGTWEVLKNENPRMMYLKGMSSAAERNAMIAAAAPIITRSAVISEPKKKYGKTEINNVRTSSGMWMITKEQQLNFANVALRRRVSALVGIKEDWIESTQILKYLPGQFYKAHNDYFDSADKFNLDKFGQRIVTVVVWLNDVESGGKTYFPNADVSATPKAGDAVVFYDAHKDGTEDPFSNHAGQPPGIGSEKWIAVFWCHHQMLPPQN